MQYKALFRGCAGKSLPASFEWLNEPPEWEFSESGLRIKPLAKTDFFRPCGREPVDSAGLLHTRATGDFTARALVTADLVGFGDAVAVTIRSDEKLWAKLCVERSPIGDISVVSVVTNGWSDDSNGELLDTPESHLRVTRKGNVFGMHFSTDGDTWRFVRTFALEMPETVLVGVHAQAPFVGGCSVRVYSFELADFPVEDFRSGE